ncbi:MAG: hypothetical protein NC548_25700 [Lachnospiraceae bacterium]|nr:hypothetical protein [Lachnospiraceae bacterium]
MEEEALDKSLALAQDQESGTDTEYLKDFIEVYGELAEKAKDWETYNFKNEKNGEIYGRLAENI